MQTQLNTLAPYLQQLKQKLRELMAKIEKINTLDQEQRLRHEMKRDELRQELHSDYQEKSLPEEVEIHEETVRQQVQKLSLDLNYWNQLLRKEEMTPLLEN